MRLGADRPQRSRLAEAAAQARAFGAVAHPLVADLTVRDEVATAVAEAVARTGGLDVVVSNAAGTVFGHFLEVEPEDFDRSVEVTFPQRSTSSGPRSASCEPPGARSSRPGR
ncbi:MAG: SDR family NAD(P)-dependent oxidoreductase [Solirubrobacteraceae bacterium]